jgi:transposase-like protein
MDDFENAIAQNGLPETVTIDKSGANLAALHAINAERETPIKIRQSKYLNNLIEQDHRAGPIERSNASSDAGIQELSLRSHHLMWHRTHAHDSERTDADGRRPGALGR